MVCELDHRQFLLVPDVPLPPPPTEPLDEDGWLGTIYKAAVFLLSYIVLSMVACLLLEDQLPDMSGVIPTFDVSIPEFVGGMLAGFSMYFVLQRAVS